MKYKTYKTAKTILKHSLAEIEEGHWCKGSLGIIDKNGPKHCAIGLVSFYGGDVAFESYTPTRIEASYSDPIEYGSGPCEIGFWNYTNDTSPQGCQDAVMALFNTLPKKFRVRYEGLCAEDNIDTTSVGAKRDAVVAYNDSAQCGPKNAAKWFRKALESVK